MKFVQVTIVGILGFMTWTKYITAVLSELVHILIFMKISKLKLMQFKYDFFNLKTRSPDEKVQF